MMTVPPDFMCYELPDRNSFYSGWIPQGVLRELPDFEDLWNMHPPEFHLIRMHGRLVHTPRWQQAYGRDYHYTGRVNVALAVPAGLSLLFQWTKQAVDERLNGLLLNWYDGLLGHYIGRHRDSVTDMIEGAPILTISLGEERIFRLRPWLRDGNSERIDFKAANGAAFVMPFSTNLAWTHEVPPSKKWKGRRISVTVRAFGDQV